MAIPDAAEPTIEQTDLNGPETSSIDMRDYFDFVEENFKKLFECLDHHIEGPTGWRAKLDTMNSQLATCSNILAANSDTLAAIGNKFDAISNTLAAISNKFDVIGKKNDANSNALAAISNQLAILPGLEAKVTAMSQQIGEMQEFDAKADPHLLQRSSLPTSRLVIPISN